jgi:hypothetical protein
LRDTRRSVEGQEKRGICLSRLILDSYLSKGHHTDELRETMTENKSRRKATVAGASPSRPPPGIAVTVHSIDGSHIPSSFAAMAHRLRSLGRVRGAPRSWLEIAHSFGRSGGVYAGGFGIVIPRRRSQKATSPEETNSSSPRSRMGTKAPLSGLNRYRAFRTSPGPTRHRPRRT